MACTLEDQLYYTSKFKSAILSDGNCYLLMVAKIDNLVEFPHYPNFGYIIYIIVEIIWLTRSTRRCIDAALRGASASKFLPCTLWVFLCSPFFYP